MATYISKVEVLLKISELKEQGEINDAMKLQKVFLGSIEADRNVSQFSSQIALDRKAKKIIVGVGLALSNSAS